MHQLRSGARAEEPDGPAEQPKSLADVVAEVIGDERPTDIQHYAKRPLRTAARFGTLDASAIDDFLTPLVEQDRALATSLLLALPKRLTAIDGPDRRAPLDGAAVAAVLASATAEIRAQAEATPAILSPAAWLVRRACTVDDLPASAAAPLVDLVGHIAKAQQEPRVPAVEAAAHTLSRLLPKLSRHEGQPLDLDKVARAVAQLPLTPEGGRAALVAAIGKVRPESVVGEAWWSGVTLNELAGCATGILGGVTSRPAVAERVIRPLVIKELSAVSSRTRLGFLLGLPREFAAQFPVDAVAAAFRRIAAEDQVVAGWVNALAQNDRVNALQRDVERARAEVSAANERAKAAEQRAAELADRCDRLEETLSVEHAEAGSLRSAQDRQIQIDVIRALADLAAEVEELATNHLESEVLVERVRALIASQALEPIGLAGRELPFDPTLHEPIVGAPAAGAAVTVIRPGYQWCPSGEEILIDKALVTTM